MSLVQTCYTNTKIVKKLFTFNYLAIFFSLPHHKSGVSSFLFALCSFLFPAIATWQSLMYIIPFFLRCVLFLSVGVCNFVEITNRKDYVVKRYP